MQVDRTASIGTITDLVGGGGCTGFLVGSRSAGVRRHRGVHHEP